MSGTGGGSIGRDAPGPERATAGAPIRITSRSNALLKQIHRLAADSNAYRRLGRIWLEGEHLCLAALARGWVPDIAVFSSSNWPPALAEYAQAAIKNVVIDDLLFREVSGLESPAQVGFMMRLPAAPVLDAALPTVVLDRLQDAGNVGSILRSAAAFGFAQVVALAGTAALWSPKVVRAGMGAHFCLRLVESIGIDEVVETLAVPWMVTSSHRGEWVHAADLPWPCAWVLGHEGQGVQPALAARAAQHLRIAQPGGEESLNVAAAAAICLHASAVSRLGSKL